LAEVIELGGGRVAGDAPGVPVDLERVAAQAGGPEVLSEHGDARGDLDHVEDSGDGLGFGSAETADLAAEEGGARDERHQHAGPPDVDAELRLARDLLGTVEPVHRTADELPVL